MFLVGKHMIFLIEKCTSYETFYKHLLVKINSSIDWTSFTL